MENATPDDNKTRGLSRRSFLGGLGVASVTAVAAGAVGFEMGGRADAATTGTGYIPFFGAHQSGIGTPTQDRLHTVSFDLTTTKREDVQKLLQDWTKAAALLCEGKPVGNVDGNLKAPPGDTGEQIGLKSSRLTITVGFGPTLFIKGGVDRFGLASKKPPTLNDFPPFDTDALDPALSGGDLCIQVCGDDSQVIFHAVHNLTRIARGTAVLRWAQFGFGKSTSTSVAEATPRNLMGSIDGTNNIKGEDTQAMDTHVWVGKTEGPEWMVGGSYMAVRRIRMLLEVWDRSSLEDQEDTIGRHKASGAPFGGKKEHDVPDFHAKNPDGTPVIPMDAHVRLANPDQNGGARILRRGYSFTDGIDQKTGQLDAGLFFVSYQRDLTKLTAVLQLLAGGDKLNDYIRHMSSAVFAVPPGVERNDYFGSGLFV